MIRQNLWIKYSEIIPSPFFPSLSKHLTLRPSLSLLKQREGLQEMEEGLEGSDFERKIEENKQKTKVHLEIPKFKIETEFPLGNVLARLGMTNMFGRGVADFRGISDVPLYVSEAIQKAFIEVDETGTEAAAATAIMVSSWKMARPPRKLDLFVADHPFLFFVRDLQTKLLLFQGRVTVPSQD